MMRSIGARLSARLAAYKSAAFGSIAFLANFALAGIAAAQMTLPGQFAVSPSGAATYTIPIQVPPGVGGMEPKLALTYNSQAGNGLLGVGWSLSGLSSITRCPRTLAQDGVRGSVNYDTNDRFCLDGQRLIAIGSGVDGANGTEYRTEQDGFAKIVSYAETGATNGPGSFIVKTKSGLTMEFGTTGDSKIEAQGKIDSTGKGVVEAWLVSKVADVEGNYYSTTYVENNALGSYYPLKIEYARNARNSSSPVAVHVISFEYESRQDVAAKYQAGSVHNLGIRLKKIALDRVVMQAELTSMTSHIKEYGISYTTSSSSGRSIVNKISECAQGACRPALNLLTRGNIGYKFGAASAYTSDFTRTGGWLDNSKFPRILVDVNGDGSPDIIGFGSSGVFVGLNSGGRFAAATRWTSSTGTNFGPDQGWTDNNAFPRSLLDVNGDGLPDIVGFSSSGVYVALNTGSGFASATRWSANTGTSFTADQGWTDNDAFPRFVIDVTGDGRPDIVGFSSAGVYVAVNTGSSFAPGVRWSSTTGASFTKDQGWTNNSAFPRSLVDVNGDGLPDIVGFSSSGVYVALNLGGQFAPAVRWSSDAGPSFTADQGWSDNSVTPRSIIDVNGDGLPDIVGFSSSGVYVALNTGNAFAPGAKWSAATGTNFSGDQGWANDNVTPRLLVDLNGDGLPDVVGFSSSGVYVALNSGTAFAPAMRWDVATGASFTTDQGWSENNTFPRQVVDVDGDGLPDVLGFGSSTVLVAITYPGGDSDKIISFGSDGGATINVDYKTPVQAYPLQYVKSQINYGSKQVVFVNDDLVVLLTEADGRGGVRSIRQGYANMVLETGSAARGDLGFEWTQSKDASTGLVSRTCYRQDWPYIGMVDKVLTATSEAGLPSCNAITDLSPLTATGSNLLSLSLNKYTFTATNSAGTAVTCKDGDAATCASGAIAPGKRYQVYGFESYSQSRDWDGTNFIALPANHTTQAQDSWGNVTSVMSETLNADGKTASGYSKTTTNTYLPADTSNWLLGRLQQSQVKAVSP